MEMLYYTIGCAVIAAAIIFFLIVLIKSERKKPTFSFKESLDLTELPIITLYSEGRKFNFILDTGSNNSFINKTALKHIKHQRQPYAISVIGMEGNPVQSDEYELSLAYKDFHFESRFYCLDLTGSFDRIKKESGVTIHGILGNDFFIKYKYVLDFKNFTAKVK